MSGWQHCAEILVAALCIIGAVGAVGASFIAVVKGYRVAAPLRAAAKPLKAVDRSKQPEEHRELVKQYWAQVQQRARGYAEDVNLLINPLRKDTIEFVKESANWGRLGVQYALVGNGGALAGLPYLIGLIRAAGDHPYPMLAMADVKWSAYWFAGGMFSAAAVCLIAYADFLMTASINWSNIDMEYKLAYQRHNDTEIDDSEFLMRQGIFAQLKKSTVVTSLSGVSLALLAWFALAWGAIRLIRALQLA